MMKDPKSDMTENNGSASSKPKKTGGKGRASPIDKYVGTRLRQRRTLMGVSQEKLGDALGVTFQQIQKYERGTNRIGAGRLFEISNILDVPVAYFYEGYDGAMAARVDGFGENGQTGFDGNPMNRRETLELVRYYYGIKDPKLRKQIFDLAKSMAQPKNTDG